MKKVLITGGLGYLGSHVVREFNERLFEVKNLDCDLYNTGGACISGDIRDVASIFGDEHFDVVVALAGIVGDKACDLDKQKSGEINYEATKELLKLNADKIIFTSSCSVYGYSDRIVDEESECNPLSWYAECNLMSEEVMKDKLVVRLPTMYGFSCRPRFDLVGNLLIAKAHFTREIPVYGWGRQKRPFCHVADVARGIADLAESDIIKGVYNLGGENMTIKYLAEKIEDFISDAKLKYIEAKEDDRNYEVDFTKIDEAIGFRPSKTIGVSVGEHLFAFHFRQVVDYTLPQYNNYSFLKEKYENPGHKGNKGDK